MIWITWIFILTEIAYLIVFVGLIFSNKKKSIGLGQFARTPEQVEAAVSQRIAPAPFYYKQRTFRLCYGMIQAFDKLLLITSLLYSALTAYLILDATISSGTTVACLVISTVSSTLKASLGLEKMAKPYIDAVRIMENAILHYEYSNPEPASDHNSKDNNPYQILLDANETAEKLISHSWE